MVLFGRRRARRRLLVGRRSAGRAVPPRGFGRARGLRGLERDPRRPRSPPRPVQLHHHAGSSAGVRGLRRLVRLRDVLHHGRADAAASEPAGVGGEDAAGHPRHLGLRFSARARDFVFSFARVALDHEKAREAAVQRRRHRARGPRARSRARAAFHHPRLRPLPQSPDDGERRRSARPAAARADAARQLRGIERCLSSAHLAGRPRRGRVHREHPVGLLPIHVAVQRDRCLRPPHLVPDVFGMLSEHRLVLHEPHLPSGHGRGDADDLARVAPLQNHHADGRGLFRAVHLLFMAQDYVLSLCFERTRPRGDA
mmetsp:Transcript_30144/g.93239  ORF Transcript_30144/g.93239 Transcript_30144/m.93239 type:complete len:312 (-) Transcript_30144:1093-2028(-)